VKQMVGEIPPPPPIGSRRQEDGPVVARMQRVCASAGPHRRLADLDLTIRAGEIVGVAGIDGNGQRELVELLTGLLPPTSGQLEILGAPFQSAAVLRRRGVRHVPEDRLHRAIIGPMSSEENVALGLDEGFWLNFSRRRMETERVTESWDVRPPDPDAVIANLSGGNQQKLVLGRELSGAPRFLVVAQPTRGLDLAAVSTVHSRLRQAAEAGAGVVLVSYDLDELFALSNRLMVMFEGRFIDEPLMPPFDSFTVGERMLGTSTKATA
jgi:general nucleoside transport system ATP-binding protein